MQRQKYRHEIFNYQSWAIAVILNFLQNEKWLFLQFYKEI